MIWQLRTYRLRPGHLDAFLALWRNHIVPARQALGFVVKGGWYDEADAVFVWLIGHEAPNGWEEVEQNYHASGARENFPEDPREHVADVQTRLLVEA
jgi:hypothetical protein